MNESEIVDAARKISSAEELAAFLERACAGDEALKKRIVERLGVSDDGALSPFDATQLDERAGESEDSFGAESAGEWIGPYRLVRPIGQGGMGSVWLAAQEEPVKRSVALKIIKFGMDTGEVIARFTAERQALALMDHPNIAKVFDAGATERGRPYFVMEYVDGTPVTKYCDSRKFSTEQRLRLFCTICQAIQHAHLKGIIHRDIKPSNVLVSEVDNEPQVKVIDFGLAKAIDTTLSDQSMFTQLGQIVGTPAYMSPEQADATLDIDTRTDVYSLGVLLYELLVGVPPLDTATIRRVAIADLQRLIRDYDPPRMSARLSGFGSDSAVTATNRSTDSRRLSQLVSGDLDVIAMKALEKDRNRRYETPASFAADIQRFLKREVIEARPASAWYRMQKFYARNRAGVLAGSLVIVAMLAATAISAWQAYRANVAAANERAAKTIAERRLLQIEKGSEILGAIFQDLDLRRIEGDGKTLEEVLGERLRDAASQLDEETIADPLTMARLQGLLGKSLYSLGHADESLELLNKSLEIRIEKLGNEHPDTLAAQHNLAESYVQAGNYSRAIELHQETLKLSRSVLGNEHYDTIGSIKDLGNSYIQAGDFKAGVPLLEEALRLAQKTTDPKDELTLTAMNSLAVAYQSDSQYERAMPLYEETLRLRREIYGDEHYDTMTGINNLAAGYYATGNIEKALPLMKEVYELRSRKLGDDHPHTLISLANLAVVMEGAGRREEALPYFEEAVTLTERKNGSHHPSTLLRIRNLANCVKELGQHDRAISLFREYVRRTGDNEGIDSVAYAGALIYLGFNQLELKRYAEAEPVLTECLRLRELHLPADDWRIPAAQSLLGATLLGLGKMEPAEPLLIAGYEQQKAKRDVLPGNADLSIKLALERLIAFYETRMADGDEARAEKWKAERVTD